MFGTGLRKLEHSRIPCNKKTTGPLTKSNYSYSIAFLLSDTSPDRTDPPQKTTWSLSGFTAQKIQKSSVYFLYATHVAAVFPLCSYVICHLLALAKGLSSTG